MAIAVSIVLSVATVVGVYRLLGEGEGSWKRSVQRVQRVVARRLAADWHDPAARAADARDLSEAIGGGVRIEDRGGAVLHAVQWSDRCHWDHTLTVEGRDGPLGTVTMCLDAQGPRFQPWVMIAALLAAIGVLWLMAGIVARRIAWPLHELTRVARDLGEGKLASRVRLRHGRRGEVGELTRAINDMAARIERQVKSQQELLAAVSHEMRTPLARVRLLVDIGRDKPERGQIDGVLDQIDGEAVQMDSLVGELLAASRLDFGAFSARELDPKDLAERAWERAAIPDGGVEIAGEPGKMQGDATLLARALTAVLDNAHKHGGGKTILRVRGTPERVLFEVDDEGPGFAPGDEERIFEPFYGGRTVPEGAPGRGTGIGLALVRRIAEAHGGRAFAARREPRGARITIELPRAG